MCVCGGGRAAVTKLPLTWAFSSASPYTVPPSKPDCSIQGETVIGNDIQLACQSKEGSPTPQYSWKSFDLQNQERIGPPGNPSRVPGEPGLTRRDPEGCPGPSLQLAQ